MNHIYRVIFNHTLRVFQAVCEAAKTSHGTCMKSEVSFKKEKSGVQKNIAAHMQNLKMTKLYKLFVLSLLLTTPLIYQHVYAQTAPQITLTQGSLHLNSDSDLGGMLEQLEFLGTPSEKQKNEHQALQKASEDYAQGQIGLTAYQTALEIFTSSIQIGQGSQALPVLAIDSGKTIHFAATASTAEQRLQISNDKAGSIHLGEQAKLIISDNTYMATHSRAANGGAISVDNNALLFISADQNSQIIFENNVAHGEYLPSTFKDAQGGAIFNNKGSISIEKAVFNGNKAVSNVSRGGAIYTTGLTSLSNTNFINNGSEGSIVSLGGAIFNTGTLNVVNAQFTNNYASGGSSYAGAIYNDGGILNITNSSFTANKAISNDNGQSGAINNRGTLTLHHVAFINNEAISNATSGIGSTDGGAIYSSWNKVMTMDDVNFIGNKASGRSAQGGAINNWGQLSISNGNLNNNIAQASVGYVKGGAIYNHTGGAPLLSLNQVSMSNNQAITAGNYDALGGAIYNGSQLIANHANFNQNKAETSSSTRSAYGGAIANDHTATLSEVEFRNNTAVSNYQAYGGAIYNKKRLDINSALFDSNSVSSLNNVSYGGAIYADSGSISNIYQTTFINNKALSDFIGFGGAIYNKGTLLLEESVFQANHASGVFSGNGGAIYNDGGNITIQNQSRFEDNKATPTGSAEANGGAMINTGSGSIVASNSTFSGNVAQATPGRNARGGALYSSYNSVFKAESVEFSNNKAQGDYTYGGAIDNQGGTLEIRNSLFQSNAAISSSTGGATSSGGAINSNAWGKTHNFEHVKFESNLAQSSLARDAKGGALNNDNGTINMNASQFKNNHANAAEGGDAFGGAISAGGTINLKSSVFQNNRASANSSDLSKGIAYGGALNIDYNGKATLENIDLTGNQATGNIGAFGGAINTHAGLNLYVGSGNTSLISGNLANGQANSIHHKAYYSQPVTTIITAANAILDMRDPMSGKSEGSTDTITVNKQGLGTWKLAGTNIFESNSNAVVQFNVDEGELYLYRNNETSNANAYDANAKVKTGNIQLNGSNALFTLGASNPATLTANGGNFIQVTNGTIALYGGSTLSINASASNKLNAASLPTAADAAINLAANHIDLNAGVGNTLHINLLSIGSAGNGQYALLHKQNNTGNNFSNSMLDKRLTIRGQDISANTRLNNLTLDTTSNDIILNQAVSNGVSVWKNSQNDNSWDLLANNWEVRTPEGISLADQNQFIDYDAVLFNGDINVSQTVTVNANGASIYSAGMKVSGQLDYTFNGDDIILASTGSSINNPAIASGTLVKEGIGTLTFNNHLKQEKQRNSTPAR